MRLLFALGVLVRLQRPRMAGAVWPEGVPAGYSLAWRDHHYDALVFAPIPLNFLVYGLPWRIGQWLVLLVDVGVVVMREGGGWFHDCRLELRPWRWGKRAPYWGRNP